MRFELTGLYSRKGKINIELDDNCVVNSIMKSSVTHLQNPYKSQCSYYDTNQNPFNTVSFDDCLDKCMETYCCIKYKCFSRS